MKKTVLILAIVLVLTFMIPLTASATGPDELGGYFYLTSPDDADPLLYCFNTGVVYGVPDGFMDGCVEQPAKPGLAQHGTVNITVDGKTGICELNIRTYDLDGIVRAVINRCTPDLAGFHMRIVGWGVGPHAGFWEGAYHFAP